MNNRKTEQSINIDGRSDLRSELIKFADAMNIHDGDIYKISKIVDLYLSTYNKNTQDTMDDVIEIGTTSTKPSKCIRCGNTNKDLISNTINHHDTDFWFCIECGAIIAWIK